MYLLQLICKAFAHLVISAIMILDLVDIDSLTYSKHDNLPKAK